MRTRVLGNHDATLHLDHQNCLRTGFRTSRRLFLKSLVALGAGSMLPPDLVLERLGQGPSGAGAVKPYRIDVHHHLLSPVYLSRTTRFGEGSARTDSPLQHWTPAKAVEEMDRTGIATSILSIPVGGMRFEKDEATRAVVRDSNEFGAKMVKDYPGRFGLLASLPLPDQDASLKEIEYAYDSLKADGIALVTDYDDKWPGDPAYVPTFEELNRRSAVVFVHPTAPTCCMKLIPQVSEAWLEYDFDTARAIASLLVNGAFERFPKVRFIFTHSGGTMPALTGRIDRIFSKAIAGDRAPNGAAAEIKKLYFDIASGANEAALNALLAVAPISQILFGTDYPFVKIAETTDGLDDLKLSQSNLQAINRDNALRLFPHLKV
jgi:predicted TIM-barrel fold metal-dependent hydrolase